MLNVELLGMIGRPGGFSYAGTEPPPTRSNIFERLVRDGWHPRRIAVGAELDRLEQSTTRGHCLAPLIEEGDVVYIDRNARPLPGDIVSFRLSERFAAGQNADLPEFDAKPCKAGDPWLKLFAPFGGLDMLFERYGHYMTTTWAACESPDDAPVLHPVRNVRRGGRLLFAPDSQTSQIGLNAATYTVVNNSNTAGTISGVTGLQSLGLIVNPVSPNYNATAIITATVQCAQTAGTLGDAKVLIRFADDSVTFSSSAQQLPIASAQMTTYTLQWEFSHSGANAGHGQAGIYLNMGSTADSVNWQNGTVQVEYIIR